MAGDVFKDRRPVVEVLERMWAQAVVLNRNDEMNTIDEPSASTGSASRQQSIGPRRLVASVVSGAVRSTVQV